MRSPGWSKLVLAAAVTGLLGAALFAGVTVAKSPRSSIPAKHLVRIVVLSTRADLVSGGEALVQVILPPGATASSTRLDLSGQDVTGAFAMRPNGKFEGLVTGLGNGPNVLTAQLPRRLRRAPEDRQPSDRRPDLLRPTDPALALSARRHRRAVRSAAQLRLLLRAGRPAGRRFQRRRSGLGRVCQLRPEQPAARHRRSRPRPPRTV